MCNSTVTHLGGTYRTLTGAAGTLLLEWLPATTGNGRARFDTVRTSPLCGSQCCQHTVHEAGIRLQTKYGRVQRTLGNLLVFLIYNDDLRHPYAPFTAGRISTRPFLGPGTAPRTRIRFASASTRTISMFCVVTRSLP